MNSMAVGYYYIPSESKIMCMMLKLKWVSQFWYHIPSDQLWLCMFVPRKIHTKTKKWWVLTWIWYFESFGSKTICNIHSDSKCFTVDVAMSLSQLSVRRHPNKEVSPNWANKSSQPKDSKQSSLDQAKLQAPNKEIKKSTRKKWRESWFSVKWSDKHKSTRRWT